MKVKYHTKKGNYIKIFSDSLGVSLFREGILRNRKVKYMNYFVVTMLQVIISVVFISLMTLLRTNYSSNISTILYWVSIFSFLFVVLNALAPLLCVLFFSRVDDGELTVDENGIGIALDEDVYLKLGWSHIRGIVVGKHSVNIILDYNYYFYFDKRYKKDIINAIREYNETILVVK